MTLHFTKTLIPAAFATLALGGCASMPDGLVPLLGTVAEIGGTLVILDRTDDMLGDLMDQTGGVMQVLNGLQR